MPKTMQDSQKVADGEGENRAENVINSESLKITTESRGDDNGSPSVSFDSEENVLKPKSKDSNVNSIRNKSPSPPNLNRKSNAKYDESILKIQPLPEYNKFNNQTEKNCTATFESETSCENPKKSTNKDSEFDSKDVCKEDQIGETFDDVEEPSYESEEEIFVKSKKNKIRKSFIDSDSENSNIESCSRDNESGDVSEKSVDSNDILQSKKNRIIRTVNTDDDKMNNQVPDFTQKNPIGSTRIKNKRTMMTDKFNKRFLKNSKVTDPLNSDSSDSEKVPTVDLKQPEFTDSTPSLFTKSNISNLYDSESSDNDSIKEERFSDENRHHETDSRLNDFKKKNDIIIEPKPQRMSAKQAMEQMKTIKSESGRMLREKPVELPYHRPKRITLKDIMDRRKITPTTGDRRLNLRMNHQQLKQYAKQLEDREKEMIELCKSESEEEEVANPSTQTVPVNNLDTLNSAGLINASAETDACQNQPCHLEEEDKHTDTPEKGNCQEEDAISTMSFGTASDYLPETIMRDSQDTEDLLNSASNSENVHKNEHSDHLAETSLEECCTVTGENKIDHIEITDLNSDKKKSGNDSCNVNNTDIATPDQHGGIPSCNINDFETAHIIPFEESEIAHEHNSKSQPVGQSEVTISSRRIECSLPDIKPKLTGFPGFIDLSSGAVKESGVESLKRRFLIHSAMKTPLDMERGKEKKIRPGAQLSQLKRELEAQISERRSREWAERLEEENQKKSELKELNGGDLSDCEDMLEDETNKYDPGKLKQAASEESGSEGDVEEEEENDVLIQDKRKEKCKFIDGEAELDDKEDSVDDNDSSDDDENSDSDNQTEVLPTAKKTRILKRFQDSGSSDEENLTNQVNIQMAEKETVTNKSMEDLMSTPSKQRTYSSDMFSSQVIDKSESFSQDWDDRLPLGQKCEVPDKTPNFKKSDTRVGGGFEDTVLHPRGRSDLVNLVSPLIKSIAEQKVTLEDNGVSDRRTPKLLTLASTHAEGKWINLQKKLFVDSDGSQLLDSQELADLCSGKFPTESMSNIGEGVTMSGLFPGEVPVCPEELSQNTENELMELCTGKFIGINNNDQSTTDSKSAETEKMCLTWSEPIETEGIADLVDEPHLPCRDSNFLAPIKNLHDTQPDDVSNTAVSSTDLKTVNVVKNIVHKNKVNTIQSFFRPASKKQTNSPAIPDTIQDIPVSVEPRMLKGKYTILSSSDEANPVDGHTIDRKKAFKTKKERNKRRARPLQISDDDDDDETDDEDVVSDNMSGAYTDANEERQVDYDSEENEIQVEAIPMRSPQHTKKAKTSEFFDNEAELTSEDEWKGSGDEDERGLDVLEREEGDADRFDQRVVKDQLEKIHMREVLDQDKREVRLLQEMLLEDGDLEGGTRERKFRWKNVDSGIEIGAMVGDDDVDGIAEDFQSEEQWRRQRHERETFLRQMEKENGPNHDSRFPRANDALSETATGMSRIKSKFEKTIVDSRTNDAREHPNPKNFKDLPSPIKKPFTLQNNVRGTFLSRGQAALHRLALLTKNGGGADSDRPKNLSSLAPGKKGNFVFAAVSPPCRETENEEIKLAKRKAASDFSTPTLIKKIRVSEGSASNSRMSLMDHME